MNLLERLDQPIQPLLFVIERSNDLEKVHSSTPHGFLDLVRYRITKRAAESTMLGEAAGENHGGMGVSSWIWASVAGAVRRTWIPDLQWNGKRAGSFGVTRDEFHRTVTAAWRSVPEAAGRPRSSGGKTRPME
jgi:hypothetical protein